MNGIAWKKAQHQLNFTTDQTASGKFDRIVTNIINLAGCTALLALVATPAHAQETISPAAEIMQDTCWEVSSRTLPTSLRNPEEQFQVAKLENSIWAGGQLDQIFKAENGQCELTVVYVHGNWTSAQEARARASMIFNALARRSAEPIRFILYSWAADREERPARDLLQKRERVDVEAYYLASFLQHIDRSDPLSVIGFSFGSAVICGALHLDAGGAVRGRKLPEIDQTSRKPIRLSLTAPAFDRTSLAENGQYGLALNNVERVLNLYNSSDPILKRYRFINRQVAPIAAGYAGLVSARAPSNPKLESHPKILQYDCSRHIGRTHAELAYLHECPYFSHSLANLLAVPE